MPMLTQTFHYESNQRYPAMRAAPVLIPTRPSLASALAHFAPVSLDAMQGVALLRRIDTKVVLHEAQLLRVLAQLSDDYEVLEIGGRRVHRYRTLYFDTPDYTLYNLHHNGHCNRYKVRARAYQDSGLAFLEVKRKNAQGLTVKDRMKITAIPTQIDAAGSAFLESVFPYPAESLTPTLWNHFRRVTLVNRCCGERLTLDFGLSFRAGSAEIMLPGIAIAEIKQSAHCGRSEFIQLLRTLNLRPMSFSKYCVGLSLLVPQVKHNHFKPQQMWLNRIIQEGNRL